MTNKEDIKDCLKKNYLPYAVSVIVSRALPNIDGFKPSHVKLLYTMYKMGLLKGNRTKSANIVGQTMKLNPHGDGAIYETLVRLTKGNESLNIPFVDSKGNFGKVYSRDMAYAASRYTEAKLMPIAKELFGSIEKNVVDMADSYDGKMKEPTILPVTYPNILTNVNIGVAVGISSNICSFNLNELCDYTINILQNNKNNYLVPDFSTGGELIYSEDIIKDINDNGRGSVKIRAKYKYNEKNNCIEITEIPYTTTVEAIIDKIEELVKLGRIKEIADVRDETDLSGLKLAIDLKKNINVDTLMGKLFKMTPLEDSFSCNFNILINGYPKLLGVKSIIDEWLKFRKECIKREMEYDIKSLEKEYNKLKGLEIILTDLDKAISIIRSSKTEPEAMNKLIEYFNLNQEQVEHICTIKLINMNDEWIHNEISKLNEIDGNLNRMREDVSSDKYYTNTIISQLEYVKSKYGQPRRTTIVYEDEVKEIKKDDLIEDYNTTLTLSKEGYFKKLLRFTGVDSQKIKDGDSIIQVEQSNNKNRIMFLTDKGNGYMVKLCDIDTCQGSTLGTYLPNVIGCDKDESIIYMFNLSETGYMIFGFSNGKIAKVNCSSYITNNKKLTKCFNMDSKLLFCKYIEKDIDITMISDIDKCVIVNTQNINSKGSRSTQGVMCQDSKDNSVTVKIFECSDSLDSEVKDYYFRPKHGVGCFIKKEHVDLFK